MSLDEDRVRWEQELLKRLTDVELLQLQANWSRGFPRPPSAEQIDAGERERKRRGISEVFGSADDSESLLGALVEEILDLSDDPKGKRYWE